MLNRSNLLTIIKWVITVIRIDNKKVIKRWNVPKCQGFGPSLEKLGAKNNRAPQKLKNLKFLRITSQHHSWIA